MDIVESFRVGQITYGNLDLRKKAQELEARFLSAMLSHAGLGAGEGMDPGFSGGSAAAQFASLLRDEQAKLMVQSGGIGLAETIFRAFGDAHAT